ncbi:MAG TPA: hypothetical protein DEF51_05720 [Myxococcales bacterium]|nr:hypothetical protein [Myxococcales bacterium]
MGGRACDEERGQDGAPRRLRDRGRRVGSRHFSRWSRGAVPGGRGPRRRPLQRGEQPARRVRGERAAGAPGAPRSRGAGRGRPRGAAHGFRRLAQPRGVRRDGARALRAADGARSRPPLRYEHRRADHAVALLRGREPAAPRRRAARVRA